MPKPLKWFVAAGLMVVVLLVGVVFVLHRRADAMRAGPVALHEISFPLPFPLSPAEVDSLGLSPDEAMARALHRARDRGRHLVEARYGCADCHGADFGGGTMAEAGPVGSLYGPNLTTGTGGRTGDFTPSDWDAIMPAVDFVRMSDRELSDLVAYIRSRPPVDRTMPPSALGPLGKVLVATGRMPYSADLVAEQGGTDPVAPPAPGVTPELGAHVAAPYAGCHGLDLAGGPVPGGPPDWPLTANLTSHSDGLAGWRYQDFRRAVLEGRRPDGAQLLAPMAIVLPLVQNMTDVELEAMWLHLSGLPPLPGPAG